MSLTPDESIVYADGSSLELTGKNKCPSQTDVVSHGSGSADG